MAPWAFDFTNRCGQIGKRPVLIEKQLTEITDHKFGQRHVLTLARYTDNGEKMMVKIRHDLHPDNFDLGDLKRNRELAELDFIEEIRLVEEVADIDGGPKYIDHAAQSQGPTFPFPGGNVYFIVMTRVPGVNLNDIYHDLTDEQLESIRLQLAHMLEHMRLHGFLLTEQHPSLLQYDVRNDKLYIVDYSFITFTDPDGQFRNAIDRNSPFVAAFDIWRRDTPGILGGNYPTQAHASRVPAQSAGPLQELPRPQVQSGSRPQGQPGTKLQGQGTQLPQRPAVNPGHQRSGSFGPGDPGRQRSGSFNQGHQRSGSSNTGSQRPGSSRQPPIEEENPPPRRE